MHVETRHVFTPTENLCICVHETARQVTLMGGSHAEIPSSYGRPYTFGTWWDIRFSPCADHIQVLKDLVAALEAMRATVTA